MVIKYLVLLFHNLGSIVHQDGDIDKNMYTIKAYWLKMNAPGILICCWTPIMFKENFYKKAIRPKILYRWTSKFCILANIDITYIIILFWGTGK